MTLLEGLEEILAELEKIKRDAEKADQGNRSAGTRMRKDLLVSARSLKGLRQLSLDKEKE